VVAASQRAVASRLGFLRPQRLKEAAMAFLRRLDVRPLDASVEVGNLSGGNQQKVLLARWLMAAPRVLIADEPTRGVDVGAKGRIHAEIQELARSGVSVLLVSSDLREVLALSHRVAVFRAGRLVRILEAAEANEETVMRYAAL
jgi:ABC-type sugar transport system ATPase subunit